MNIKDCSQEQINAAVAWIDNGQAADVPTLMNYALAVTAPWEWTGPQGKVCNIPNATARANIAVGDPHEGDYQWYLDLDGGKLSIYGECESLELAKKTARAAYLCWMRGRLALVGVQK